MSEPEHKTKALFPQYRDIFKKPGEGLHRFSAGGLPIIDFVFTFLGSAGIYAGLKKFRPKTNPVAGLGIFGGLWMFGGSLHYLCGVNTRFSNNYLGIKFEESNDSIEPIANDPNQE